MKLYTRLLVMMIFTGTITMAQAEDMPAGISMSCNDVTQLKHVQKQHCIDPNANAGRFRVDLCSNTELIEFCTYTLQSDRSMPDPRQPNIVRYLRRVHQYLGNVGVGWKNFEAEIAGLATPCVAAIVTVNSAHQPIRLNAMYPVHDLLCGPIGEEY